MTTFNALKLNARNPVPDCSAPAAAADEVRVARVERPARVCALARRAQWPLHRRVAVFLHHAHACRPPAVRPAVPPRIDCARHLEVEERVVYAKSPTATTSAATEATRLWLRQLLLKTLTLALTVAASLQLSVLTLTLTPGHQ